MKRDAFWPEVTFPTSIHVKSFYIFILSCSYFFFPLSFAVTFKSTFIVANTMGTSDFLNLLRVRVRTSQSVPKTNGDNPVSSNELSTQKLTLREEFNVNLEGRKIIPAPNIYYILNKLLFVWLVNHSRPDILLVTPATVFAWFLKPVSTSDHRLVSKNLFLLITATHKWSEYLK